MGFEIVMFSVLDQKVQAARGLAVAVVKREHGALLEQMALQEINSANYGEAIFASHLAAHSELV